MNNGLHQTRNWPELTREREVPLSRRLLQRQRRIRHAQSRRPKRLARRETSRPGNAHRLPPLRCRHHPHVLGPTSRQVAEGVMHSDIEISQLIHG